MIFSSHATGYLPSGYYTAPYSYKFQDKSGMMYRGGYRAFQSQPVPYHAPEHDPSLPEVKSIGQDQVGNYGSYQSYEIEIEDFAKALPMKMEYILFDACLMGGVEVAYEIREKCRKRLGPIGIYPLPRAAYSMKYRIFRLLANSKCGMKALRLLIPSKKPAKQ